MTLGPWSLGQGVGSLARTALPTAGSPAAILWLLSARPPPSAQARSWRREVPASTRCDAPGRRRRVRGPSSLGWPCGGRGRLRPHFSAFPNCGRWEGARRAGESVEAAQFQRRQWALRLLCSGPREGRIVLGAEF